MNKRSISQLTRQENFNNSLLSTSMSLTQQLQRLPSKQATAFYRKYPAINEKHRELQSCLLRSIKTFGMIFQVSSNVKGARIIGDYAVEIFQEVTDMIETRSQKYEEQKNRVRREQQQKEQQIKRPQDLYPNVKPTDFTVHTHEKNLQNIRTDSNITESRPISEQCVWIDTPKDLQNLIETLGKEKEIAVDLEHSSKSYYGMTSLIQISSRQKDYVIDVFPLWKQVKSMSKIFGNPEIIKVMHGAEMDVKWLQRDFDIHISNLFDTYKASRVLGMPKFSLAFLLSHYCNVDADKSYQLADWRIRPLTVDMMHYARCDTHYLLEIWDLMRRDLAIKAEKINENTVETIRGIYENSHPVTVNETELFSYQNIDIYQNLSYQMKNSDFSIIDRLFTMIDHIAMDKDEAFYDIVSKKLLIEALGTVKDLVYNQKSKVSKVVRIDRVVAALRKSKYLEIGPLLTAVKNQLEKFFFHANQIQIDDQLNSNKYRVRSKKAQEAEENRMDVQNAGDRQTIQFQKVSVAFSEYGLESFESPNLKSDVKIRYQPLMQLLANRYGIETKDQNEEMIDQQEEIAHESSEQEEKEKAKQSEEDSKQIKFSEVKRDTVYRVEDPEIGLLAQPKKKRKEQQYEERVKSQKANIYSYFEQN